MWASPPPMSRAVVIASVQDAHAPGVLDYRDTVMGPFRALVWGRASAHGPVRMHLSVSNPGPLAAVVIRTGQDRRATGSAWQLAAAWWRPRRRPMPPLRLPPGHRLMLTELVPAHSAGGIAMSAVARLTGTLSFLPASPPLVVSTWAEPASPIGQRAAERGTFWVAPRQLALRTSCRRAAFRLNGPSSVGIDSVAGRWAQDRLGLARTVALTVPAHWHCAYRVSFRGSSFQTILTRIGHTLIFVHGRRGEEAPMLTLPATRRNEVLSVIGPMGSASPSVLMINPRPTRSLPLRRQSFRKLGASPLESGGSDLQGRETPPSASVSPPRAPSPWQTQGW